MILDIDKLINFFDKYSELETELIEQEVAADAGASTGGGGGGTGKTPKKWESGRVFGKTYTNDPKSVWTSNRTFGKTYMNDPKYVWKSDRNMGKTGGSDYT